MTNRGGAVIIQNGQVALIKRVKGTRIYYVFPGGRQEPGEAIKDTTAREVYEELGVRINVRELLEKVPYNHGYQYYFKADIIGGVFGTGAGEEFSASEEEGRFEPVWMPLSSLSTLDIFPQEVVQRILSGN